MFSPDGRWIAYASNESGTTDVYVQSYPMPATQLPISISGGTAPRWRRDGREIFYLTADRNKLMAVAIQATATGLDISAPVALFEVRTVPRTSIAGGHQYDVSADGQRFLVNLRAEESTETPITVVTNWTASLKK